MSDHWGGEPVRPQDVYAFVGFACGIVLTLVVLTVTGVIHWPLPRLCA